MSAPDDALDPEGLAASYALGALDPAERAAVEVRLRTDQALASEVAGFERALGDWGASVPVDPPPAMRAAVMHALDGVPQLPALPAAGDDGAEASDGAAPRLAPVTALPRQSRRRPVVALLASAAAAVVVVAAGVGGWQLLRGAGAAAQDVAGVVDRLESAPDAVVVPVAEGSEGDWAGTRLVYSDHEGEAVVSAAGSIAAPESGVYVVWWMEASGPEVAGSFHSGAGAVLDGPLDDAATVAVTVEPDADAESPTTPPVAVYEL